MGIISSFTLPVWVKPAALGVGLLVAFYGGYHIRGVAAERDMLAEKNTEQAEVLEAKRLASSYEESLNSLVASTGEQSYANEKKHNDELAYYRDLVKQYGGLFDTHNQTSNSQATGSPGSNQTTTSGTRLSEESTQFLLKEANKADQVTDQYLTCQKYVVDLTNKANAEATK